MKKQKIDFILEEDDYQAKKQDYSSDFIRGNHAVTGKYSKHQSLGMKQKWIMYGLSLVSIKMKMRDQIG